MQSTSVDRASRHTVRVAGVGDVIPAGHLLHDFNVEFGDPTPTASNLADRLRLLLDDGDALVLLAGEGPEGIAVLRFRRSIWSAGSECNLAELFVTAPARRLGIDRALMDAAVDEAVNGQPTR